ncbi:FAD-dependent oxidoreductase [Kibdelosporangium phytohabitans]|uniref:FAD-dependent oxidoreductase n=2 Tax=Kibdelosporangium phytohabitans TaxID=860235 RepID=A0A0N9I6X6_9PSEU|nr:FAD-dependent oxidoreductase [Kibdelosporangium phytohabitans]
MVAHVVVIGAGVYGAAVSASLTRRGARVTVVDAGAPGGGTSGATFSWVNSCGKQPRAYHDLNVAGMHAHRESGGDWFHEGGNLEWADGAGIESLRHKVTGVLDYGYEAHWLGRAEALRLEPDIDPAVLPDDGIAFFPQEGWVEPTRMVAHLLSGIEVIRDAVVGFDVRGDRVRSVRLAAGQEIAADAVVNCAGPRAADVAGFAGLHLPMCNKTGVLVYTSPVAVSIARVIHAPQVHMRPDGGGRLLLHNEDLDVGQMLTAARAVYPGLRDGDVESVRAGERPIPADRLPVLGRVLSLPNFHFAVSHSGVTLSVYAGEQVAAEVLGEDRDDVLRPFRFERF